MAYVTVAVAKAAVPSLDSYTDAQINAKVAEFEDIAERYRGVAYVTRTATSEEIGARPLPTSVQLKWPKVQSVTNVKADTVALDLSTVTYNKAARIIHNVPWPHPTYAAEVTYVHGFTAVPALIVSAAIEYASRSLAADNSGTSRDVRSQAFDGGTTSYITPDWQRGRPTGWTEVDRLLNSCDDYRTGFA